MDFFGRLKYYIDYKHETVNSFTHKCEFSSGLIAKLITNKTAIGSDKLMKIFQTFPDLSPTWLLTGNGEMILNLIVENSIIMEPTIKYGRCLHCEEKERLIKQQQERIEELKDTISILKDNRSTKRNLA